MVSRKPVLVFDTSAINQLTAEKDFPAIAAGLTTAYHIRLTGSNISELVATPTSTKRASLFDCCQRLLASGDCIDPFNWIVEKHVQAFDQNALNYDWKRISVRNRQIEREIVERTLFDDDLAHEEKESAGETKASFENYFSGMRPRFDQIFSNGTERPATLGEFVSILQRPGGAFWTGYGRTFYARNVQHEPEEKSVRDLADRCPPFLMMVLAAVMAQYARAIVGNPKKKKRAGRVDLLMSVYLPYCRVFVTHDDDQTVCLREIGKAGGSDSEILSYAEFRSRLLR